MAVLVGVFGVLQWPLHFAEVVSFFPGNSHARLMAHGFLGGFMFGFLGTSLPRMLSARPLRVPEFSVVLGLYTLMCLFHAVGEVRAGDATFVVLLGCFGLVMAGRWGQRGDIPPPGFLLVALAFACGVGGAVLYLIEDRLEDAFFWLTLRPLLYYQGFLLLPVLGVGSFILPRFFGEKSKHLFDESMKPPKGWWPRALLAFGVGLVIVGSFVIEASGWTRIGHGVRFVAVSGYLVSELSLFRLKVKGNLPATALMIAFALLVAGVLAVALFPEYRAGLLHLALVGGVGVITLTVGMRVVFGHSGNLGLLKARNRWFKVALVLMLVGMATRISGDIWPKILVSHYIYGALLWGGGVGLWGWYVLPKVLVPDPDE